MKLAVALQERADLNRKIAQLRQRLLDNSQIQEGEDPAEDPKELLKELDGALTRLKELITTINLTNAKTVYEGKTMTEMIAERDVLKEQISAWRDLISSASQLSYRARNTEIRILPAVNVRSLQKKTDDASGRLRRLDAKIQELNWTTEI